MPKKRKLNAKHQNQRGRKPRPKPQQAKGKQQQQQQQHRQKQHEQPTIPFDPGDRILLIGEGDLSFAAALAHHHACTSLVATVLEKSQSELLEKYPHAASNVDTITSPSSSEHSQDEQQDKEANDDDDAQGSQTQRNNKIVYGIDATKPLPASVSRPAPNRIIFNFPHIGGKSTDVNRQVRHNQSLLVSFFTRAALPALAPGGTIIVTLFEAEPYTLWNVRDLARHAGLQVERSFRFQSAAYPGYHHARTLGVVRSRAGEEGGGWRGEERAARSYVFVRKGEVPLPVKAKGKKRRREEGSDDDNDSDD